LGPNFGDDVIIFKNRDIILNFHSQINFKNINLRDFIKGTCTSGPVNLPYFTALKTRLNIIEQMTPLKLSVWIGEQASKKSDNQFVK